MNYKEIRGGKSCLSALHRSWAQVRIKTNLKQLKHERINPSQVNKSLMTPLTTKREKLSLLGYNQCPNNAGVKREPKSLVFLSFSSLKEAKLFLQWMSTCMLVLYTGWPRRHKRISLARIHKGRWWLAWVFPVNAILNQFQPAAISHAYQWSNRLRTDFLTSWFRWDLNQSNKVEMSELQRNSNTMNQAMSNPWQPSFTWKCPCFSWLPHTIQKVKIPTPLQMLASQPLSLPLLKLLLHINHFWCPVGTKSRVYVQSRGPQ